jgi:hypothetical protein
LQHLGYGLSFPSRHQCRMKFLFLTFRPLKEENRAHFRNLKSKEKIHNSSLECFIRALK